MGAYNVVQERRSHSEVVALQAQSYLPIRWHIGGEHPACGLEIHWTCYCFTGTSCIGCIPTSLSVIRMPTGSYVLPPRSIGKQVVASCHNFDHL